MKRLDNLTSHYSHRRIGVGLLTLLLMWITVAGAKAKSTPHDHLTRRLIHLADSVRYLRDVANQDTEAFTLLRATLKNPVNKRSVRGMAKLYYELGLCERKVDHLAAATAAIKRATMLARQLRDTTLLFTIGYGLSVIYADQGNYAEAVRQSHLNLNYCSQSYNLEGSIMALNMLSEVYNRLGNKALADKYAAQQIQLARRSKDPIQYMMAEWEQAESWEAKGNYRNALTYQLQTIAIARTLKPSEGQSEYLTNQLGDLGRMYRKLRQLAAAQQALNEALFWEKKYKSVGRQAMILEELACLRADQGQKKLALQLSEQAVAIARKTNRPDLVHTALDTLRRLQERYGQYKAALLTTHEVRRLSDSLANVVKTEAVATVETRYKVAAKEATIQELRKDAIIQHLQSEASGRQQTQLIWLTISLSVIMAFIGLLLVQSRQLQHKTEEQRQLVEQQATELQHLNQEKDKLFGIISHDLRVPAINLKRLLIDGQQPDLYPSERSALWTRLEQQVDRFNQLVDNLLYWSLTQRGKIQVRETAVFLDELVDDTLEQFTNQLTQKSLRVIDEVAHKRLVTDENLMGLVLRNLLHNAIKFTPRGGEIALHSRQTPHSLELHISDTGPGLSATQNRQDRPFPDTGTGLGLVVSKELMHRCGGRLLVQELHPNGTEIILSWPLPFGLN